MDKPCYRPGYKVVQQVEVSLPTSRPVPSPETKFSRLANVPTSGAHFSSDDTGPQEPVKLRYMASKVLNHLMHCIDVD